MGKENSEVWKDVSGFEGRYEVSTFGRVRNANTHHVLATQNKHGYRRVTLHSATGKDKNCAVHRLVALTFLENPDNKPEVNHKDGVRYNNHIDNLEWVTPEENFRHAVENDLYRKGIERAKYYGRDVYNKKDKPMDYLGHSKYITRAGYNALITASKQHNVSITKLASLLRMVADSPDVQIDYKGKRVIASKFLRKRIEEPYIRKIEKLGQENERLRALLKEQKDEQVAFARLHNAGTDMPECGIGEKRNHLTIIGYARDNGKNLVCRCDCGKLVTESATWWLTGAVKSCGCLHNELTSRNSQNRDDRHNTHIYDIWVRCHRRYNWCGEWQDFSVFYDWSLSNGYHDGCRLWRKDTDRPFSPDNCFWKYKERQTQGGRKPVRYLVDGEELTVREICDKYNLIAATFQYRLKRGMTAEEAVHVPLCTNGRKRNVLNAS